MLWESSFVMGSILLHSVHLSVLFFSLFVEKLPSHPEYKTSSPPADVQDFKRVRFNSLMENYKT